MSTEAKLMHSMRCDHPDGCSAELETYDGGSWLYDSATEARVAAYDHDWVTDGTRDYCNDHRDYLAEDDQITPHATAQDGVGLFPAPAVPESDTKEQDNG